MQLCKPHPQSQMEIQPGKANEPKSPYNVTYVGVKNGDHLEK